MVDLTEFLKDYLLIELEELKEPDYVELAVLNDIRKSQELDRKYQDYQHAKNHTDGTAESIRKSYNAKANILRGSLMHLFRYLDSETRLREITKDPHADVYNDICAELYRTINNAWQLALIEEDQ